MDVLDVLSGDVGLVPVDILEGSMNHSFQGLLKDGVGGRSLETESVKEEWGEAKLSNKDPVDESRVGLEAQEDKESREWKVRRSSERRGFERYHIAKLDKSIE